MKNFFIAIMIVIVLCSTSFSAKNEDIYVRKDLFESHMNNIDSKFAQIIGNLDKIDSKLEQLIQYVGDLSMRMTKLETRLDGLEKRVDDLREDTKGRIGDLNNSIYLWSVILGLVAGLPFFKNLYDDFEAKRQARRTAFTLEDVEKLVTSIIDAKMKGNLSNAI